jgi:hypothetical protein
MPGVRLRWRLLEAKDQHELGSILKRTHQKQILLYVRPAHPRRHNVGGCARLV